jgi:hypothetical protein
LSYRITVNRSARRSMKLPKEDNSSCLRRCVIQPESNNNAGPAPDAEYATRPASVLQYLIPGLTRTG